MTKVLAMTAALLLVAGALGGIGNADALAERKQEPAVMAVTTYADTPTETAPASATVQTAENVAEIAQDAPSTTAAPVDQTEQETPTEGVSAPSSPVSEETPTESDEQAELEEYVPTVVDLPIIPVSCTDSEESAPGTSSDEVIELPEDTFNS